MWYHFLKSDDPLNLTSPVGVFKWIYNGKDAALLTVNCLPDDEGSGTFNFKLEFNLNCLDMTLTDVNILMIRCHRSTSTCRLTNSTANTNMIQLQVRCASTMMQVMHLDH